MWNLAKCAYVTALAIGLSACASTFSSYDSNFSCKNSDHGGCEHPMVAYEKARSMAAQYPSDAIGDDDLDSALPAGDRAYDGYKDALYGELETLVRGPGTPIIVPAKTVRTLILPYTDPSNGDQRLYMPRYVFTVLEEARFVLGLETSNQRKARFIEDLISSTRPDAAMPNRPEQEE